jgi:hypothetical protein
MYLILLFMARGILNGVESTVMREQIAVFVVGQGSSSDVNCDNIRERQKEAQGMSNMVANMKAEIRTEKCVLCRRGKVIVATPNWTRATFYCLGVN